MIYILRDEYNDGSDDILAVIETNATKLLMQNIRFMWTELEIVGFFVDYLVSELDKRGIKCRVLDCNELYL